MNLSGRNKYIIKKPDAELINKATSREMRKKNGR